MIDYADRYQVAAFLFTFCTEGSNTTRAVAPMTPAQAHGLK